MPQIEYVPENPGFAYTKPVAFFGRISMIVACLSIQAMNCVHHVSKVTQGLFFGRLLFY